MAKNLTLNADEEEYVKKLRKGYNGLKLVPFTFEELLREIGNSVALGFPCADSTVDSLRHLQRGLPGMIYNNGIPGGPLVFAQNYPGFEEAGLDWWLRRVMRVVPEGASIVSLPQPHWPCKDALGFGINLPTKIEKYVPAALEGIKKRLGPDNKIIIIFHQKRLVEGHIRQRSRRLLF